MGLLVAMALYPIISPSNRHRIIVIVLRLIAVPLAIVMFVVLIRNFYKTDPYAGTYHDVVSPCPTLTGVMQHAPGVVTSLVSQQALTTTARGKSGSPASLRTALTSSLFVVFSMCRTGTYCCRP